MRLTKTNSGNWAKEVVKTGGGRWKRCTRGNVPLNVAEHYLKVQTEKGRKAKIEKSGQCRDGQEGYQVLAYICKKRVVMQHASKEECLAVGKIPGTSNT